MSKLIDPNDIAVATIWQEAQGEEFNGKVGVGEVIRTRMKRNYSSDGTVAGTVCKSFQFSAWNDDYHNNRLLIASLKLDRSDPIVQECVKAWERSFYSTLTQGAVLYCNRDIASPSWATDEAFLVKIDHHSFYKD